MCNLHCWQMFELSVHCDTIYFVRKVPWFNIFLCWNFFLTHTHDKLHNLRMYKSICFPLISDKQLTGSTGYSYRGWSCGLEIRHPSLWWLHHIAVPQYGARCTTSSTCVKAPLVHSSWFLMLFAGLSSLDLDIWISWLRVLSFVKPRCGIPEWKLACDIIMTKFTF